MNFFIIFLLCYSTWTYSQNGSGMSLMQGSWQCLLDDDHGSIFKIVRDQKCIEFTFTGETKEFDLALFELIIGFQNYIETSYQTQALNIDSLKANGLYYTEVLNKKYIEDGEVENPNFLVPSYYKCDGQLMSINGGKLFEYEKINQLPYKATEYLYHRGKRDGHDYIKDYLDLLVLQIQTEKCVVNSEPNKPTQIRLKRNQLVIVIEDAGKWLKVRYGESEIGWIKKQDTH